MIINLKPRLVLLLSISLVSLFLCGCLTEQYHPPKEFNDAKEIYSGSFPTVNTAGTMIAFSRYDSVNRIYLGGTDGVSAYRITTGSNPTVSPDGNSIAFIRYSYGIDTYSCSLIVVDGKSLMEKNLLSAPLPYGIREIKWSPDGSNIAFSHDSVYDSFWKIIRSDGSGTILNSFSGYFFNWSPDGKQFVYTRYLQPGIIIGSVGSKVTVQVNNAFGAIIPVWLPDGNAVAYLNDYGNSLRYYSLVNGTDSVISGGISTYNYNGRFTAISPDGRKVAEGVYDGGNPDMAPSVKIYIHDAFSKTQKQVALLYGGDMEKVLWSADSRTLYFSLFHSKPSIYRYTLSN
ncbi:MAG: hypothetical protein ACOYNS_15275 [Bacteroidota bacterium]